MKEIELHLVPQPGSKPEFLAKLAICDPSPAVSKVWTQMVDALLQKKSNNHDDTTCTFTPILVLEAYTRDNWAWKPTPNAASNVFPTVTVQSTDGRHKLPGFVKHLKDRQKSAYGRFGKTGIFVVSYIQSKSIASTKTTADGIPMDRMECRIALDCTLIPNCPLLQPRAAAVTKAATVPPPPPPSASAAATSSSRPKPPEATASLPEATSAAAAAATATASSNVVPRKGGGGLLGKLVGAQHRTNQHVISATTTQARPVSSSSSSSATTAATAAASKSTTTASTSSFVPTATVAVPTRTAQDVLTEFRQVMEQKMLDFDENNNSDDDQVLRVELNLAEHTAGLSESDQQKVTMEILKYMVYEACEEVNDEWIAHKEPSEFMDDNVVICVYKTADAAPPEVLEEIQKGELPDEVVGQQRALAEEQMRKANQAERQKAKTLETVAHQYYEGVDNDDDNGDGVAAAAAALGTKKRDRRSVEEYELEKKKRAKSG
jgi:hypothetical protein